MKKEMALRLWLKLRHGASAISKEEIAGEKSMSHVTRFSAIASVVLAGTLLILAAQGSQMVKNPLLPITDSGIVLSMEGSQIFSESSILRETNAVAVSAIMMATYCLCLGPGPPITLRSVRAAIGGVGSEGRKARTFPNPKSMLWRSMNKARIKMHSRFHIA